jgi:hypothetical protein
LRDLDYVCAQPALLDRFDFEVQHRLGKAAGESVKWLDFDPPIGG